MKNKFDDLEKGIKEAQEKIDQLETIEEEWSESEREKRKSRCSDPKGFSMKQFCKNQETRSKKGEKKNESIDSEVLLHLIREHVEEYLEEKRGRKKKKKKKGDRCTRIAKRKYKAWPSAYASGAVVQCRRGKIWKGLKEDSTDEQLAENLEWEQLDEKKKKKKAKSDFSLEKKKGLAGWFSRRGDGEGGGEWVDCNTCRKDPKTGRKKCKSCGRKEGEKRAKYPRCRPTPSQCKGYRRRGDNLQEEGLSEGMVYHIQHNIPISHNIYRTESENFFAIFREARSLCEQDLYEPTMEEAYYLLETDIGEFALYEDEMVPLDYPMIEETEEEIDEAEYRGKKVELGKPKRGGSKKFYVYVKDGDKIKKVSFGDTTGLSIKRDDPARRKSFRARHNCDNPGPKTMARYWSCYQWRAGAKVNN